jgi:alpha/beta superfamily hydrolase
MQIFFFHGLESGPHGSKYQTMSKLYDVISPDFTDQPLETRLQTAEEVTRGYSDAVLVGSSFGGLVSALLYDRYPERFASYLLLAPALHYASVEDVKNVPQSGVIIHGTNDDIVPIEPIRQFAEKHNLKFIEVEDGHRLAASHDALLEALGSILESHTA